MKQVFIWEYYIICGRDARKDGDIGAVVKDNYLYFVTIRDI